MLIQPLLEAAAKASFEPICSGPSWAVQQEPSQKRKKKKESKPGRVKSGIPALWGHKSEPNLGNFVRPCVKMKNFEALGSIPIITYTHYLLILLTLLSKVPQVTLALERAK